MNIKELKKLILEIKFEEALQKGLKEVGHPFKAFFIFGPAGSGKSFIKSDLGLPTSFVSLNVDEVVEKVFPKFGLSLKFLEGDIEKKQEVRKLLQQAVSDKTKRKINQALPLLFDTTGENTSKMKRIIRSLVEIGYDVAIFQVNVPPDFSVEADKDRPRTIGEPLTRDISNMYQKNIISAGAYAQMDGQRGITLLSLNAYPNLFNIKTGALRPGFDPAILSDENLILKDGETEKPIGAMPNPFYKASWEKAENILKEAKGNLQNWLSDRSPENAVGKLALDALEYIQVQGVADYGDQITDIPAYAMWATENEISLPDSVKDALTILFKLDTFEKAISSAVTKEKYPTKPSMVKTAKGEKEVPPELLPRFGQKGAPNVQQLTREQLEKLVNMFNNKNKT